jgi:hypothetical protein
MFLASLRVCLIHYPPNILSTKGFEIEFRALLTDDAKEVRFERVAVGST